MLFARGLLGSATNSKPATLFRRPDRTRVAGCIIPTPGATPLHLITLRLTCSVAVSQSHYLRDYPHTYYPWDLLPVGQYHNHINLRTTLTHTIPETYWLIGSNTITSPQELPSHILSLILTGGVAVSQSHYLRDYPYTDYHWDLLADWQYHNYIISGAFLVTEVFKHKTVSFKVNIVTQVYGFTCIYWATVFPVICSTGSHLYTSLHVTSRIFVTQSPLRFK